MHTLDISAAVTHKVRNSQQHALLATAALLTAFASGCTINTYSTRPTTPSAFSTQPAQTIHVAQAPRDARNERPEPIAYVAPAQHAAAPVKKPATPHAAAPQHKPAAEKPAAKPVEARPVVAKQQSAQPLNLRAQPKALEQSATDQSAAREHKKRLSSYERIAELARRTRAKTEKGMLATSKPEDDSQSDMTTLHDTRDDGRDRMVAYTTQAQRTTDDRIRELARRAR